MRVLKEYIRYYISGALSERSGSAVQPLFYETKGPTLGLLRKYVRSVIQEINEVCGDASEDVADALATAQMAHLGQKRRSGEPYLVHPVEVASIVHRYYPENTVLCAAALLHDSLEDALKMGNVRSNKDMESLIAGSFGDPNVGHEALRIVKALTHASGADYTDYVLSMSSDPDVLKIKLSDMLHNLQSTPSDKQRLKYKKALNILSPEGHAPAGINKSHWTALMNAVNQDLRRE